MPVSRDFGKSVGAFIRNLTNPRWVAAEASKQGVAMIVINPYGQQVKAWLKAHLHIQETDDRGRVIKAHHVADAYECSDGHEYLNYGGRKYLYDKSSDSWRHA